MSSPDSEFPDLHSLYVTLCFFVFFVLICFVFPGLSLINPKCAFAFWPSVKCDKSCLT